jgi:hypothetical protein
MTTPSDAHQPHDEAVRPALTPRQWVAYRIAQQVGDVAIDTIVETILAAGDDTTVMALANAGFPDGDPHRFTAADVALLNRVANVYAARLPRVDDPALGELAQEVVDRLRAIAARIAALLPPPDDAVERGRD